MNKAKTVLITGSSTGFGWLTAQTLATAGHTIFASMRGVTGKNAAQAITLATWAKENNADLTILELDVTSDDSVEAAATEILSITDGTLDVIVNNAGIYGLGVQESFTTADYKNIFDVNVFGPARINNRFLPVLRRQGSGLIIQISSVVGRVVIPFQGVYTATKFAVEALAENLHYELSPLGIQSVIVQPGPFLTEVFGKLYQSENSSVFSEYGETATAYKNFGETFNRLMGGADVPNQPQQVADAIKKLIDMPYNERPLRTTVDQMMQGTAQHLNDASQTVQAGLLSGLGLGNLLRANEVLAVA